MFREHALRSLLYSNLGVVVTIIALIYNLFRIKEKKNFMSGTSLLLKRFLTNKDFTFFSPKTFPVLPLIVVIETFILFIFQYLAPILMNPSFGEWVNTGVNYFGLLTFAPLFTIVFCLILWINPLKQMDFAVIAFPLALFISKIACFFAGCCNGIEWIHGVFNYSSGRPEIPVQLIESLCALLIFIILLKYKRKAKPGTVYPMYLILYCSIRFFTEFLRAEPNILGPLKTYHLLCISGMVFGIVLYVIVVKFGNTIADLFESTTYFTKGQLHEMVSATRVEIANTDFSFKSFINSIKLKSKKTKPVIK